MCRLFTPNPPPNPPCMKIVVASVMEMNGIFQKHMDPEITPKYSSCLDESRYVNSWQIMLRMQLILFLP